MAASRGITWSPSVSSDKNTTDREGSGRPPAQESFSDTSTSYLRASMVCDMSPAGAICLEAALDSTAQAASAAAEASAVSDMLSRGCRTTSLNATLVDSKMRRMASAEAALTVDLVSEPREMRSLLASSWREYEFTQDGPLGIQFSAADEATPLVVQSVVPDALASQCSPPVSAGMRLEAIQLRGMQQRLPVVERLGFSQIIAMLSTPNSRPLKLWFSERQANPHGSPLPVAMPVGEPMSLTRARSKESLGGAMTTHWAVAPLVSQQWIVLRETPVYSWRQPTEPALEPWPEPEPEPEQEPEQVREGIPGLPSAVTDTLAAGREVAVTEIFALTAPDSSDSREILMAHHSSRSAPDGVTVEGWSVVEGGIQAGGSKNLMALTNGLQVGDWVEFGEEANTALERAWLAHDELAHHKAAFALQRGSPGKKVDAQAVPVSGEGSGEFVCDVHQMTATAASTGLTGVLRRELVAAPVAEQDSVDHSEERWPGMNWEVRVPEGPFWPSEEPTLLRVKCSGLATAGVTPGESSAAAAFDCQLGGALLDFRSGGNGALPAGESGSGMERWRVVGTAARFGQPGCWTAPVELNVALGDPFTAEMALKQLPVSAKVGETAVLLSRGVVPFVEKARHADGIGAAAVIIVNSEQQHFIAQGHQYNDSDHVERQEDNGEGLEALPVITLPLAEGQVLEARLRKGERVVLENCRYSADPEERAVVVPPGASAGQKLRFQHPVWAASWRE